ncbi:MAG TPA: 8-amino-7-oxononanoate synthase [Solirubrobacteraceae bacterium]|nr:8-amino-7-oxononanoate synthase [Solirubrobacteraceae bacterium]
MTDVEATMRDLRRDGLYRQLRVVESAQGPTVRLAGRDVILLCSNDYLGLAGHPSLRDAVAAAAERWGAGAGASRLVSGNMSPHAELEQELADFKGYQRCVLFGSGFLANVGVLSALAGRGDVILSDELNHASIVDGCRLSRAETIVYKHADLESLEHGLRQARGRDTVVVTDAVFSMDGDLAPLRGIAELAQRHGARVVVDEAHATGVVGPGGRGLVAALGLHDHVDVVIGTLGKALGSYGAFACSGPHIAEFLINRARTLIYSTALPPPTVAGALAGLRLLAGDSALVRRLWDRARLLRGSLARGGFQIAESEMPIVPLIFGAPSVALAICEEALTEGVFVQAIRPPTVPRGTSRLRAVVTAAHTDHQCRKAALAIAKAAANRDRHSPFDRPVPLVERTGEMPRQTTSST